MDKHKAHHMTEHKKDGYKPASHRVSDKHTFKEHDPYALSSMYGKMVTSQNKKHEATRSPGSRDDFSVPSQMHGDTRNVQHGA